jgi:hypothetical protein
LSAPWTDRSSSTIATNCALPLAGDRASLHGAASANNCSLVAPYGTLVTWLPTARQALLKVGKRSRPERGMARRQRGAGVGCAKGGVR